jgi:parallel beta-helix repeat protein
MMFTLPLALATAASLKEIALTPATSHITTSVCVKKGVYTLDDRGNGALQIDADGVTVDFQGSTLQSSKASTGRLEDFTGLGLTVMGHSHVTVKNAVIHGFRFNVKAYACCGLRLLNCKLGMSRSQRMLTGDAPNNCWVWLRNLDCWRDYGGAVWLENCTGALVKGVIANQCQNGLFLVGTNKSIVADCDFSYESGWGISLWGSSDNLLCWNHADFVDRPFGSGWGADSSGIVLCNNSNRNVWAYNSFTHGGDGLFLATTNGGWDDKGKLHEEGTCDYNEFAYDDGSWSPSNAFEATFSIGNVFYRDWCDESSYGFWLGFERKNLLLENEINGSHLDAIATEHGPGNLYIRNDIERTRGTAIHLWAGKEERSKQSPSADNVVFGNRIVKAGRAYNLDNSTGTYLSDPVVKDAPVPDGVQQSTGPAPAVPGYHVSRLKEIMALRPAGWRFYRDTDLPKGWQWLAPSEYGMRDYRGMIVPWMMKDARTLRLLLRPNVVKSITLPEWMDMKPGDNPDERYVVAKAQNLPYAEYRNFSIPVIAKDGRHQTITGHVLDVRWNARWFKWFRSSPDAYKDAARWSALFAGPALREETLSELTYRSPEPGLPGDHYALVATTKLKLSTGTYRFDSISDDGIQVYVDGKAVIDDWTHHTATGDTGNVKLTAGIHEIVVHYCQEDGDAALSLGWTRVGD